MAAANVQPLIDQVAATLSVEASALACINGIAARQQAAIDAALALGATQAELAPLVAENDLLKKSSADLAAAVLANTPAVPVSAAKKKP